MLADDPTNVCALTPVIARLVVFCFSLGRMLSYFVLTLTGLTLMGVSVIFLRVMKR